MIKNGSSAKLFEGYGLTETVTVCAVNTFDNFREGSVGKTVGKLKIEAFTDHKKMLNRGQSGELCISGDQLMQGYLGDESSTNKTFFSYNGEKWVRSGDIGYVDDDGFVFFKSRIKRIAKVSGITVFPSEIENLCMNELEEIKEAHAVADSDNRTGDAIVMFVSTKSILSDEEKDALSQRITNLVESRLSVYARPRRIFFLPELPKTQVGKVDSNKLKDIYL
jgi:long-chain acyl-CoA synthetase